MQAPLASVLRVAPALAARYDRTRPSSPSACSTTIVSFDHNVDSNAVAAEQARPQRPPAR